MVLKSQLILAVLFPFKELLKLDWLKSCNFQVYLQCRGTLIRISRKENKARNTLKKKTNNPKFTFKL